MSIGAAYSRNLFFLLILFAANAANSTDSEEARRAVILAIERIGEFEVLHSRAETTGTGMILFGLIGYGIEEGSRASQDKAREDAIFVDVPEDACQSYFVEALSERLSERNFDLRVVYSREPRTFVEDYLIRLRVDKCGFRKVNTTSDELSAFLSGEYEILLPGQSPANKFELISVNGKERKDWDEFVGDLDSTIEEFRLVKAKAGRRLANKLIYLQDDQP